MANQYQNGQQLPPHEHNPESPHEPIPPETLHEQNLENGGNGNGNGSGSLGARRAARREAFREKLRQMALPLKPLVQMTTGHVHPAFPVTLLNFWLLTDWELEELAHFYHQRTPSHWTMQYPCPITWGADLPLEEKRRKIGKFIGLRVSASPVYVRTEEEILEEARRARQAEEEEMWRRKLQWY